MTTALRPPAGIDDERTRALVQVLNERFDALPVERVLVWHLPTTQAEALAFIAEALGLVGPEFGETGAARTFLTGGVQARRKKGTPAQLRAVLTTLGFGSVELTEGGELLYDDTIAYDGGWTYGYDSHWAVFWVALDIAAPLTEARANQLWDAINEWKPQRCRFVVILRYPDGARTVFRARGEADEIPAPTESGPAPSISGVSPAVADKDVELVTITGSDFDPAATVTVGGVAASGVTWVSATELECYTNGAMAYGVHDVVVTNPDAQDSGASGAGLLELWHPTADADAKMVLMPGDYDDVTGTWTDSTAHANDAVAANAPDLPAAAAGCPVFTSSPIACLVVPSSLADEVGYPAAHLATHLAGTVVTIDIPTGPLEADAGYYYNGALYCGDGATPGLAPTDAGYRAWAYDGTDYRSAPATSGVAADVANIAFVRWDEAVLETRTNGGAFVSASLTDEDADPDTTGDRGLSVGNIGATTWIGCSYAQGQLYDGTMKLVAVYETTKSDAWCTRFRAWALGRGHL